MENLNSLVTKYVDAFSVSQLLMTKDARWLFFLKRIGSSAILHRLDLSQSSCIAEAERLSDHDFSVSSFGPYEYDSKREYLYFYADDKNDECWHLGRFHLPSKKIERLTFGKTHEGITFNSDYSKAWGRERHKNEDGSFKSYIFEFDLLTLQKTTLLCDETWDYRIGWPPIHKIRDQDALVFTVDYKNQRRKIKIKNWDHKYNSGQPLLPE
ncbi:MAG: hypothetical protein AB7H97_12590 [Pseudobdellovibrionaceae bacterium]